MLKLSEILSFANFKISTSQDSRFRLYKSEILIWYEIGVEGLGLNYNYKDLISLITAYKGGSYLNGVSACEVTRRYLTKSLSRRYINSFIMRDWI